MTRSTVSASIHSLNRPASPRRSYYVYDVNALAGLQ